MIKAMQSEFYTTTYAWFLHDHLGSTVAVYGSSENGEGQLDLEHAYEYRSFGEMAELTSSADKVTENFTGKEKDDKIELDYFGARYLDPMLGMWISVDPARQFTSPYLYVGNGMNPVNGVDPDGNEFGVDDAQTLDLVNQKSYFQYRMSDYLVQECMFCRVNTNGSIRYSERISAAIKSENYAEIRQSGSIKQLYEAEINGGAVSSIEDGFPAAIVINGNAQDALHELTAHVFPAILGDRPGNGSAINEELMNSPEYLYLSPLDVPDHPIDQIHYDTIGE